MRYIVAKHEEHDVLMLMVCSPSGIYVEVAVFKHHELALEARDLLNANVHEEEGKEAKFRPGGVVGTATDDGVFPLVSGAESQRFFVQLTEAPFEQSGYGMMPDIVFPARTLRLDYFRIIAVNDARDAQGSEILYATGMDHIAYNVTESPGQVLALMEEAI